MNNSEGNIERAEDKWSGGSAGCVGRSVPVSWRQGAVGSVHGSGGRWVPQNRKVNQMRWRSRTLQDGRSTSPEVRARGWVSGVFIQAKV